MTYPDFDFVLILNDFFTSEAICRICFFCGYFSEIAIQYQLLLASTITPEIWTLYFIG